MIGFQAETRRCVFFGIFFLAGLAFYFLPTLLGMNKRNAGAIFALNLLLGWTLVGWVVALVWALATDPAPSYPTYPAQPVGWSCGTCHGALQPGDRFCRSCAAPVR
jgi:hypothetical protein